LGFAGAVDFEIFRRDLVGCLGYSDGSQGGRPPFDPVMMFKILVIRKPTPNTARNSGVGTRGQAAFSAAL
jgi:hypothetical protein